MTTFLDSSVVIALIQPSDTHNAWAVKELGSQADLRPAIISDIVYCEVSIGMSTQSALDTAIVALGLERRHLTDAALFRAGRAFKKYRDENKGKKHNVLPDFLIGAVAEVNDAPLMTANARDIVTYFPNIKIICPP